MARANHTHILFILDRSGSMQSIRTDVVGGINQFLTSQKTVEGTADVTLVQFDNAVETVHHGVDIQRMKPFTDNDFEPRGSTALFDAMGLSMEELGRDLAARKEADRPANVVVAVMTDGEENASVRFDFEKIRQMIEHQRSFYNWDFIFLASELRTLEVSRNLGVAKEKSIRFSKDSDGMREAYASMDQHVAMSRRR